MWTKFMDMHSGGGLKNKYEHIFIEADNEEVAINIFQNKYSDPNNITCSCCGEDYSVSTEKTFALASAYERNNVWINKTEPSGEKRGKYHDGPVETIPEGWASRYIGSVEDTWISIDDYLLSKEIKVIGNND